MPAPHKTASGALSQTLCVAGMRVKKETRRRLSQTMPAPQGLKKEFVKPVW